VGKSIQEMVARNIRAQKQQFSSSKLGLPIAASVNSLREENLLEFFGKWSRQQFKDRDGAPVRVIFRGKPVPGIKVDLSLLQRTIYNIMTDAINHTLGRPVYITLRRKKGRVFISVTNEGKKLTRDEMKKIGRERYSRRMDDPRRGYGKIMVRLAAEALGGKFHVGNSQIGPLLEVSFPEPAQNAVMRNAKILRLPRRPAARVIQRPQRRMVLRKRPMAA